MLTAKSKPPTYPTIEMILGTLADWITKCRNALGTSTELNACGPDEVARIAHELGIGPAELYQLAARGPGSAALLQKMLPALGIDGEALARADPLIMRDLERLCFTCGNKKRCEHELAAGTAAQDFKEFCPNAVTLEALIKPH